MAVASGPAGPVLAGSVFAVIFGTAHGQIMNNLNLATATATGSITDSRDIPEKAHQQVN